MPVHHHYAQIIIETLILLFGDGFRGCQYHQRVRLAALSVGGVPVRVGISQKTAMRIEPQSCCRHLVHYGVNLQQNGLAFLLDKRFEHTASVALPPQAGVNGEMLYIDIGVKFPIGDKTCPLAIVRIARQMIRCLLESPRLLRLCALLKDGETAAVNALNRLYNLSSIRRISVSCIIFCFVCCRKITAFETNTIFAGLSRVFRGLQSYCF